VSEFNRVAFTNIEIGQEMPQPHPNIVPGFILKEAVTFDTESVFPIADTTTLPPDFYEHTNIDGRYRIDGQRLRNLDRLRSEVLLEKDSETRRLMEEAQPHFDTLVIQTDYIIQLFNQLDASGKCFEDIEPQDKLNFFKPFAITDFETAQRLNIVLFGIPKDLWETAFSDPGTTHEVLGLLKEQSLIRSADISPIQKLFDDNGVSQLRGKQKVDKIRALIPEIQAVARQTEAIEREHISEDSSTSQKLRNARMTRKRDALDCIDGATYAASANHGVIVPPQYLLMPEYKVLRDEPLVFEQRMWATLKHTLSGFPQFSNDHTCLYRNLESANTRTGVAPDYAVTRPGNFLAHDIKLLEHGPERESFEYDHLFEYLLLHYIEGMNIDSTSNIDNPDTETDTAAYICSTMSDGIYYTPMYRENANVIPFRAMKKDFESREYYEYGAECYMAELVDAALEMDLITAETDSTASQLQLGNQQFGSFAKKLVERLYTTGHPNEAQLAVRQLLFMRGYDTGALDFIEDNTIHSLSKIDLKQRINEAGNPQPPKPPLTCAYHWFQEHARPVSDDELTRRGVPIKPPLFNLPKPIIN